ncbi:DUF805 domain-containing protein [Salinibius halmophilus]|uniref:DUF805 domain-containing protein n=1 Tax=Salinibius halmophilus TaxID=1853216 RepID=UPI000E668ED0|nr:DUF805 domain-containing protein [Salinibius halmophilus]
MTINNPYATPEFSDAQETEVVDTRCEDIFSTKGRIGRMRYFAYGAALALASMAVFLVMGVAYMIVSVVLGLIGLPDSIADSIGYVVFFVSYIALIVYSLRMLVFRRLHDLGHSGWLFLLSFIPLVNIIFGLYMILAPGNATANQYGGVPTANQTWVKVVFWILMAFIVLAIVAQILIASSI